VDFEEIGKSNCWDEGGDFDAVSVGFSLSVPLSLKIHGNGGLGCCEEEIWEIMYHGGLNREI